MAHSRRHFLSLAAAGLVSGTLRSQDNRAPGMIIRSVNPQDFEMPLDGFQSFLTPVDRFFVRTHVYAPQVELASWKLQVAGEVANPLTLTMDDLKMLPRAELVSVLECAGNGRSFYEPTVPGAQWRYGAVGNARWTGVRLADVLKKAGVKNSARELIFDGADVPIGKMPDFQRGIPLAKAMDPNTLLAYQMNAEPLTMAHGFPLRVVVPGWAGDSWVKWLQGIRVLDSEFDGFWMKSAYRRPAYPVRPGEAVDAAKMRPVTSLRVKSVIATPLDGSPQEPGRKLRIAGAAWAGDAGPVSTVDVSTDSGRTWKPAALAGQATQYGWRLWEYTWTPPHEGFYNLMSRARTMAGDVQPFAEEWNPSGYQWNVIHRVGVAVGAAPPAAAPEAATSDVTTPDGFKATCMVCHQEDMIRQQRLTRAQWNREIDKMAGWGAPVKPDQRDGILNYLVSRFPPRP